MMTVVVNKNMEVSGNSAASFRNMAVWEGGYNLCLDFCRAVDNSENKSNGLMQQLKTVAAQVPLNLAKSASYKPGKQYVRHLRNTFVSTKELGTLLLICHDLNYMNTEKFLDLNTKVNTFSSKLWKYIKYNERKARRKVAKK